MSLNIDNFLEPLGDCVGATLGSEQPVDAVVNETTGSSVDVDGGCSQAASTCSNKSSVSHKSYSKVPSRSTRKLRPRTSTRIGSSYALDMLFDNEDNSSSQPQKKKKKTHPVLEKSATSDTCENKNESFVDLAGSSDDDSPNNYAAQVLSKIEN